MTYQLRNSGNKLVGNWLMLGVVLIIIQVVLGGITRLTGSGLSITEWDVIKGIIPPLNHTEWLEAFNKYKQIPQYEVLNDSMKLSEFKWIYFWEYIHRFWARIVGIIFIVPFVYFVFKGRIEKQEIYKYVIVMVLAGIQARMGWVMVASGLEDRVFVDPLKLMLHLFFATALLVLVYRLALENLSPQRIRLYDKGVRKLITFLVIFITLQICIGGLVAGSRAALAYPTWPKMGSVWIPGNILSMQPIWKNFVENLATIQLLHRIVAYLLVFYTFYVILRSAKVSGSNEFHRGRLYLMIAVVVQLLLGILTVISSKTSIPVFLGVMHQLAAMVLLLIATYLHYTYKYK